MKESNLKLGDQVEVVTSQKKLKGLFIPSDDRKFILLKLDSGYNIGIKKSSIKNLKKISSTKLKKSKQSKITQQKNLPKISIIHTGGTIASRVDYKTGGTFASFTPTDLLSMFPEIKNIANIKSELFRNMWSDDLRFKHFSLLAKKIQQEIKSGVEGIIISMGTDNLAVASAALSFIIQKSPIPILFVGAQRSSDRPSSDAAINLISAVYFITNSDFSGLAICMHNDSNDNKCVILPPNKTKKLHTSRRDAFQPVNSKPLAFVDFQNKKIDFKKKYMKKDPGRKPEIKPDMEEKVGLIKITINMFVKQFECFKGFKGLIIEGTGLGHTPGDRIDTYTKNHPKILKAIKSLIDSNTVVVMTSSCINGRVGMNVYSKGRDLQSIGVIPGGDMLSETALVKLSWLLANFKPKEVKELIRKNLVNEISPRIKY